MKADTEYRLVALVPMRHTSVRVPEKNFRTIAGKPLYSYILDTLMRVSEIERIVVNTDSAVISQGLESNYPEVQIIERPKRLLGDDVPMNEILLHDVSVVNSKYYIQTHSTNPLMQPETFSAAISQFLGDRSEHDALFGVTRRQVRIWDENVHPINHDPDKLENTQDLKPFFEENSCLYLFTRQAIQGSKNRLGSRPSMFEVPPLEAIDIDTEADFELVRLLIESEILDKK
jgi:CMP-N-acetylneuraminic acid synthetase